ncbi:MAG: DoxX family membrane protein [Bacteroidales bacterium]|nr:DoxX family membrane protein [Bacteroidales bacterium]
MKIKKYAQLIIRFILALVFLFSGFVKGVDPLGTAYKIEDYFIAYGMDWALSLSLITAFGLIALEFSLGMMLLLNLLPKFTRWAMLFLLLFFTFVTLYDAFYNPVPDCGCFGDAFVISNWQTFYKNLILDGLLIGLFLSPQKKINLKKHLLLSLTIFFLFLSFSYYNLQHLPLIDFRFWKIGTQVYTTDTNALELYVTYQHNTTGEKKEFLSPNYPYQDAEWNANWTFVSSRQYNPNQAMQSLMIFDQEGSDVTCEVLGFQGKSLLIVSHDLEGINNKEASRIKNVIQFAENENLPITLLTATIGKKITEFITKNKINIPLFLADDIDLKTIIRSNPGLILLENGKVIKKWSSVDMPISSDQIYN